MGGNCYTVGWDNGHGLCVLVDGILGGFGGTSAKSMIWLVCLEVTMGLGFRLVWS